MIKNVELKNKIVEELSSLAPEYDFQIGSELIEVQKLSNNIQNSAIVDDTIYGVFSTISGDFEALEGKDLATLFTQLTLYVENRQFEDMSTILAQLISSFNGMPYYDDGGDYAIIPVFGAVTSGTSAIFNGDDRISINVPITYTIAKKGIISNTIDIYINGNKMVVFNGSFSMVKGVIHKQYNRSNLIKGKCINKAKTVTMVVVNTGVEIINDIKEEILDDETIGNTYTIRYNDGFVDFSSNMLLENGTIGLTSGSVTTLTLMFSNKK